MFAKVIVLEIPSKGRRYGFLQLATWEYFYEKTNFG
jgi:hypothetical protein